MVLDAADRRPTGERLGRRRSRSPRAAGRAAPQRLGGATARPGERRRRRSSPSSTPAAPSSTEHHVPLPALGLSPLDLVWISGDAGAAASWPSARLRRRRAGTSRCDAGAAPRLDLSRRRRPAAARPRRPARAGRRRCAGSSPAPARSTAPTCSRRTPTPTAAPTSTSSRRRVAAAQEALADLRDALGDAARRSAADGRRAPRARWHAIAGFGVAAGLAPLAGADADPAPPGSAALCPAARRVRRRRPPRSPTPSAKRRRAGGEPEPARRDRLLRRLQAVFGPGFVAVPVFTRRHRRRPRRRAPLAGAARRRPAGGLHLAARAWSGSGPASPA